MSGIFSVGVHDIGRDDEWFGWAFVRFAGTSALTMILMASVGFAIAMIALVVVSAVVIINEDLRTRS